MTRKDYAEIVLSLIPRILSSTDRNRLSDTYGCMDKAYWFYKTTDFSCARFQEPALTFALLYKNKFAGNIYFGNKKIRDYAIAGMKYLKKIQNSNGSFDEWYPNEHSFVGTAFSVYNASETYKLLSNEIIERDELIEMFENAGGWLLKHNEEISNQQAGAIATLYNLYQITGMEKFRKGCKEKLSVLRKKQSSEGWFPEYGGPDFGYLTVTIDFLGMYYKESGDEEVLKIVEPALEFLKYFIHPDGSLGGIHGSRNTEFKLPHGFEIFSEVNENAKFIADSIANNIKATVNPLVMDDRFAFQYHVSYLQAFLDYEPLEEINVEIDGMKTFNDSGLFVYNKEYYVVINMKKGGVFRMFNGKKHVYDDAGFVGKLGDKIVTSQWNNSSRYEVKGNKIIITGNFKQLSSKKNLTPSKNVLLRTFLLTAGRSQKIALFLKRKLREELILHAKEIPIEYMRVIELHEDKVRIVDELKKPKGLQLDNLYLAKNFQLSYVPTSCFFQYPDLSSEDGKDYAKDLKKGLKIERGIVISNEKDRSAVVLKPKKPGV